MRTNIIAAIGVIGPEEDIQEFAADFVAAMDKLANRIMGFQKYGGRIQLLPAEEGSLEV